jgi:phage tail P2-like protein
MDEFKFADLLPGSIKNDLKFKAAAACLDKLFEQTNQRIKTMLIYSRVDELDEQTLNDLAWQFHLDYSEGFNLSQNIHEKRELIKNAIKVHWYKGTRWSLETVAEIMQMPIVIMEWWENLDCGTNLEPYEFDLHVDTSVRGMEENFYTDIIQLVNSLKNVRSHLRRIHAMTVLNLKFYMGVGGVLSESKIIFPEFPLEITGNRIMRLSGGHYQALTGIVYPEISTEETT